MFPLIKSSLLEIIFDPVSMEERLHSVAFDITANWKTLYEESQIIIRECWLEYSELNHFEEELKQLTAKQIQSVKLNNMSDKPIILFSRDNEKVIFEFTAGDLENKGVVIIKANLHEQELAEIVRNIKNWSKWW